jgi:hypothetical protein
MIICSVALTSGSNPTYSGIAGFNVPATSSEVPIGYYASVMAFILILPSVSSEIPSLRLSLLEPSPLSPIGYPTFYVSSKLTTILTLSYDYT